MKLRKKTIKALQYTRYLNQDLKTFTTGMKPEFPAIVSLVDYAAQNPGLEYGNYCSGWNDKNGRKAYFSEARTITKEWTKLCELVLEANNVGVTDQDVIEASGRAFGGRMTWTKATDTQGAGWQYCAGQYWPTEYRAAACAVFEKAIHGRRAANFKPMPEREYTLAEMREIAKQSGSYFFSNKRDGERYKAIGNNEIVVEMVEPFRRKVWYKFDPKDGGFQWLRDDVQERLKVA